MRLSPFGLGLIFAASTLPVADAYAEAAKPDWRGVRTLDTGKSFFVVTPGETTGAWEKVGDAFGAWTVAAYRETDHILVVQRSDGTKFDLVLDPSPPTA